MKLRKLIAIIAISLMTVSMTVFFVGCTMHTGHNSASQSNSADNQSASASEQSASDAQSDEGSSSSSDSASANADVIRISGVSKNANILTYESNKSERTNKQTEFYDLTATLSVGDGNYFDVKPNVTFVIYRGGVGAPSLYNPDSWNYVINLYVLSGDKYVLVEGNDIDTYVDSFDNVNAKVDFSAEAVGESFKVEVYPEGLTETQSTDDAYKTATLVNVVDGYNVYSALELAYVENGNRNTNNDKSNCDAAWVKFKADNELNATGVNGIVLQTNVAITKDDIPSVFFYTESEVATTDADYSRGVVGSLKDRRTIYNRTFGADDRFVIEGNYFTVDCKALPLVVRPNEDIVAADATFESHASLFWFTSSVAYSENNKASVSINNVNFVGNATRSEDTTKSGGIIMLHASDVKFTAYNNISNNFIINYFADEDMAEFNVNGCKAYNAFTCLMYVWGAPNVNIVNSELIGAGGPVMIVDHIHLDVSTTGGTPSGVYVKNSELHSYVTGQEAWFSMYNASNIVSQIVAMDAAFNYFGRSFVKSRTTGDGTLKFMDFVALYKSGSAENLSTEKISGYFGEDDAALPMNFGTYADPWDNFATITPVAQYIEAILAMSAETPIFMTSAGGMSFFSLSAIPEMNIGAGLNTIVNGAPAQILDPTDLMFSGNQLYLYYSRMGLVLNYYPVGQTI